MKKGTDRSAAPLIMFTRSLLFADIDCLRQAVFATALQWQIRFPIAGSRSGLRLRVAFFKASFRTGTAACLTLVDVALLTHGFSLMRFGGESRHHAFSATTRLCVANF